MTIEKKFGNIYPKGDDIMFKETTRPIPFIMDIKSELPDLCQREVISPLHYGETLEIAFVKGIEGEIFINGKRFEFKEKNVFVIPPKYLHTSIYRKGGSKEGDTISALHINLQAITPLINLNKLLHKDNRTLPNLAFRCEGFEAIHEIARRISDESRTFLLRTVDLLKLFEMISSKKADDDGAFEYRGRAAEIIEFVEEGYSQKLTIDVAANKFGYSKQYFCKWFKHMIGVSFSEFLNTVRIHHARIYLENGYSVEEASTACGFSDPSYFAKVFKAQVGTTPKAYSLK